jgi:putative ABC transport system ATP-binding protein
MSFIVCENIAKRYGRGDSTVNAIDKIELVIENGEFVALMGESGAGKSTLLSVMGAMNRPTTGRYVVDDIDVYGLTAEQRSDFRREYLGFVFQSFHLISYLTVLENVMLPLTTVKKSRQEKKTWHWRLWPEWAWIKRRCVFPAKSPAESWNAPP